MAGIEQGRGGLQQAGAKVAAKGGAKGAGKGVAKTDGKGDAKGEAKTDVGREFGLSEYQLQGPSEPLAGSRE